MEQLGQHLNTVVWRKKMLFYSAAPLSSSSCCLFYWVPNWCYVKTMKVEPEIKSLLIDSCQQISETQSLIQKQLNYKVVVGLTQELLS